MAVIGSIRKRTGLLLVVVFGAIILFLIQDGIRSASGLFGDSNEVAEIAGETVSAEEYRDLKEQLTRLYELGDQKASNDQIERQAWEEIKDKYAFGPQYEALGIAVTEEEAIDMIKGYTVPDDLKNQMTGQDGKFDPNGISRYLDQIEDSPEDEPATRAEKAKMRGKWVAYKRNLENMRLKTKYTNLLAKTNYITTAEAKRNFNETQARVKFDYLWVGFDQIEDSEIEVTDAKLEEYLTAHPNQFKVREDARKIEYVKFKVEATENDISAIRDEMTALAAEFAETEDDLVFQNATNDAASPVTNVEWSALPVAFNDGNGQKDTSKIKVGNVVGPVRNADNFEVYKIGKVWADSLRGKNFVASHILISYQENGKDITDGKKIQAKNEKTRKVIEEAGKQGADFAELAKKYSEGPSGPNGGSLGEFGPGAMVAPFYEACQSARKTGVIPGAVKTQFGYHIIKIDSIVSYDTLQAVEYTKLVKEIVPSEETEEDVYAAAKDFYGRAKDVEGLRKIAETDSIELEKQTLTGNSTYLPGLGEIGLLKSWAFSAEEAGELWKETKRFGDYYVVASLAHISESGKVTVEDVREVLTKKFIEEQKSIELVKRVGSINDDLTVRAQKLNDKYSKNGVFAKKFTIESATLGTNTVQGLRAPEPKMIGTAFGLKEGKYSSPMRGENGVFVVKLLEKTLPPKDADIDVDRIKEDLAKRVQPQFVAQKVQMAVEEDAEIKDFRFRN